MYRMCESMSKRKTVTPSIYQSVIQSVLYYDIVCKLQVVIGCLKVREATSFICV